MISTALTAFISFISTNIDDIFVLMLFFSQINKDVRIRHIVLGQYLGMGTLTVISILGALGISVIPNDLVGLLGLIPICLGVKEYLDRNEEEKNSFDLIQENQHNVIGSEIYKNQSNITMLSAKNFINSTVIKVFGVTIANGADNIGIYIPTFTRMSLFEILITSIIFIILVALWCFMGLKLSKYSFVEKIIEKYKHVFIPLIFIGLGFFIFIESGTWNFIFLNLL